MRRILAFAMAFVMLAATAAGVLAQGASTPAATPTVDAPPVSYIDESGNPLAVFAVTNVERGWTEYSEFYAPQASNEYVRVTLSVRSMVGRGSVTLDSYDFILQDADGFISQGTVVPTEEEDMSGTFDYSGTLDLPGGQTGELTVVFEVLTGVELQALYYTPDFYARLITLLEFDEAP